MTFLDRILARFGYWRWPEANGIRDTDTVARGHRWQTFYGEQGGLSDTLEAMRRSYFERAAHLAPGDIEGLRALSLADRVCAEIDGTIQTIIVTGQQDAAARDRADKIAQLPAAMRRRL